MNTTSTGPQTRLATAGSATVMCLMSLCVVMSFGTASLTMLLARQSVVTRAIEVDEAFRAAEASVDLAMTELINDKDHGGDGIGVVSGGAGRASFTATLVPAFSGPRRYTIVATGSVGPVSRRIEADVTPAAARGAAFIGLDAIGMSGGVVDGYDSSLGTGASQASAAARYTGVDSWVQSNGNITLSGSAVVRGNATPGPGRSVSGATGVTGSTAAATEAIVPDAYVYAPPLESMGAVSSTITLGSGRYRYTSFVISGDKTATFDGDVELYVDGKLEISGAGTAILNRGAKLTIHHGADRLTLGGSGFVNTDQRPGSLTVYTATTHAVTVSGNTAFHGVLRAPRAPLTASGGAGIYGSVLAKTLTLTGDCSLHGDRALGAGAAAYRRRLIWPSGGTGRGS